MIWWYLGDPCLPVNMRQSRQIMILSRVHWLLYRFELSDEDTSFSIGSFIESSLNMRITAPTSSSCSWAATSSFFINGSVLASAVSSGPTSSGNDSVECRFRSLVWSPVCSAVVDDVNGVFDVNCWRSACCLDWKLFTHVVCLRKRDGRLTSCSNTSCKNRWWRHSLFCTIAYFG